MARNFQELRRKIRPAARSRAERVYEREWETYLKKQLGRKDFPHLDDEDVARLASPPRAGNPRRRRR
jgi:hypothetical protein